jgi:hypothetical protein
VAPPGRRHVVEEPEIGTGGGAEQRSRSTTKRDNRLIALRKDLYEGNEIDITPHVKHGDTEPEILRIHFYVDREKQRIVVGHWVTTSIPLARSAEVDVARGVGRTRREHQ